MSSSRFMLFPTLKKKFGGGVEFKKKILSHFTFHAIFNIKKILKSAPSLTVYLRVLVEKFIPEQNNTQTIHLIHG